MYLSRVSQFPSYSSFTSTRDTNTRYSRNVCTCQQDENLSQSTLSERVCLAAKCGCVRCLLSYKGLGIDFNHCFDGAQRYALHYACMQGQEQIIQLLLRAGVLLEVQNAWQATPLYAAAKYGHLKVCQLLIVVGANIHAENNYGATPLYIAADRGHTHVVQELIHSGCDINHMVHFGATPLKAASKHGHIETVKCLVKSGAHVTLDVILELVRKNQNRLTKYFLEHTDVILGKINQSKAKRVVLEIMDEIRAQRKQAIVPVLKMIFPQSLCKIIAAYDLELLRNSHLVRTFEGDLKTTKASKTLTKLQARCKILS